MLSRRTFVTAIGATAIAALAQAREADDARELLRRRVEVERHAVGMAACVLTSSRTRFVESGFERLGDSRLVSADTVFEIGSVTKVFTALLLADMARRGEIAFDDPVARHLPNGFPLPVTDGRQITLADLATHTSGLPRFPTFAGAPFSPAWLDSMARFSVEDLKSWLAEFHLSRPAGSEWEYSNAGYALLGIALGHRGGQPYEALLKSRILAPLGLASTTFHPTATMGPRVADGHDRSLAKLPPLDLGIFTAAGALRSTTRDLARFAATILSSTRASMARDARMLLTVRRPAPLIGGAQALGWEVLDAPGGTFVGKDGVTLGQTASMVFDPDRRVAIAVLCNTQADLTRSSPSGGGVGAADIARHLLRPELPLG